LISHPDELIAQHPAAERSASRLLDGRGNTIADRRFGDLPDLPCPATCVHDTQVVKARLFWARRPAAASSN
jgi:S-adenosylmethionine:tRNA ribosyltransferase-isomerase